MPELPEVETTKRQLIKKIRYRQIKDIWSDNPKTIANSNIKSLKKTLIGKKITIIKRRGKNIFIEFDNYKTIWMHLKMTGHLLFKPKKITEKLWNNFNNDPYNGYIHLSFYFSDGTKLDFSDLRKFGRIKLLNDKADNIIKNLKKYGLDELGKEPLEIKSSKELKRIIKYSDLLKKKKKTNAIKVVLMDQKIITGIGNIYASEILFDAKINPNKKASNLKNSEYKNLLKSIKKILKKAIKERGTSISDFRDTEGSRGEFGFFLKVYQRAGKKCFKCDNIIEKFKQTQRTTFFCPKCQK